MTEIPTDIHAPGSSEDDTRKNYILLIVDAVRQLENKKNKKLSISEVVGILPAGNPPTQHAPILQSILRYASQK